MRRYSLTKSRSRTNTSRAGRKTDCGFCQGVKKESKCACRYRRGCKYR